MLQDLALPGPEIPVINEARLLEEFGGDMEILAELRDLFLVHVPPLYEAIVQALDSGDCVDLAKHAHTLKGACATYGAPRLALLVKEMELQAKQGDLAGAEAYREHLTREYETLYAAVSELG